MEQSKLRNIYIFGILSGGFCPGRFCPWGFCPDTINNSHSFIPQILKVVGPLGKMIILCSPLGFEIQINNDYQTSKFKLYSFIAFQRYLTDKNPAQG